MGTKKSEIMDTIRERVVSRVYKPGERLPGVADIETEFHTSTSTAVYAMRALAEDGYVDALQGVGYFAPASLPARSSDDLTSRQETQRAVVASLRSESRRLGEIADRLERSINP